MTETSELRGWGSQSAELFERANDPVTPTAPNRQSAAVLSDAQPVATNQFRLSTPLGGLTMRTQQVNGGSYNRWPMRTKQQWTTGASKSDNSDPAARKPFRLTLPARDARAVGEPSGPLNAAVSSNSRAPGPRKWAVTAAVGAFLRDREAGVLDFTQCDPKSEVLLNLLGTKEAPADLFLTDIILQHAKSIEFPPGMECVPNWIKNLRAEIIDITLPDYRGECVRIENKNLAQLCISGQLIREIYVPSATQVFCTNPSARAYSI